MNSHPHFPAASSPPLLDQAPDQHSTAPDSPLHVEAAATQLDKVAIVNALQLEVTQCHARRSGLFLAKFVMHTHTNYLNYFPASDQNSDITIRFSNRNYLEHNLVIR